MTATISNTETLRGALGLSFSTACGELVEARLRLRQKDSPRNRTAVAECTAHIDEILDMHLDADRVRCPVLAPAGR